MLRYSVVACARGRLQAPEPPASSGGLAHVFRQLHALKAGSAAPLRAQEQFDALAHRKGPKSGRGRTPHPKGKPAVAELLGALDTAASASAAEAHWEQAATVKPAVVASVISEKEEFIMSRTLRRLANVPVRHVVYASIAKQSVVLFSQRVKEPYALSVAANQPSTSPELAACAPDVKASALCTFLKELGKPTTGDTLLLLDDHVLVDYFSGDSQKLWCEKIAKVLCQGKVHIAYVRAGRNPASPLHLHRSATCQVAHLRPVSESIAPSGYKNSSYVAKYVPKKGKPPPGERPSLHSPFFLDWATAAWEQQTAVTSTEAVPPKKAGGGEWRASAKDAMLLSMASLQSADVVIYTDASVPHGGDAAVPHKQMGTGATIVWPSGQVTIVGASAGTAPANSGVATSYAEMQAIQNALAHVLPQLRPGSHVALLTDSNNCVNRIMQGPTRARNSAPLSLYKMLLCDLPEAQSTLHLVHMIGHTGVHGNVLADLLALQFSVFDCDEEAQERKKSFLATIPRTGSKREVSDNTNRLGKVRLSNTLTLELTQSLVDKVRNPPDGDNEKEEEKTQ
eukprot:Rhum_TRINITY_DN25483_c0_g1::Rhum_TRINITY_DN25483_c0_g1_i1::g.182218::m.182218